MPKSDPFREWVEHVRMCHEWSNDSNESQLMTVAVQFHAASKQSVF